MFAGMILPAEAPLEAPGRALRALYRALNSPVVTLERFPVGPAAAAAALHEGGEGVTLAVRSVRTGQIAFFTTDAELASDPRLALDATLSFGESMGFVFDEDEVAAVGEAGPLAAAALWCELLGESLPEAAPLEAKTAIDEIVLEEIVPAPAAPAEILSKFRWTALAAPSDA
jgi:hypothetical protein